MVSGTGTLAIWLTGEGGGKGVISIPTDNRVVDVNMLALDPILAELCERFPFSVPPSRKGCGGRAQAGVVSRHASVGGQSNSVGTRRVASGTLQVILPKTPST
jgi:hypothetical protein